MKIESPLAEFKALEKSLEGAEIFNYGHLPAAAAYCRRLGFVETVNSIVASQMNIQPGVVVQAMVLDTLSGRSPLYRLKEFLTERDVELLTGDDLPAEAFSDVNVGRSLDAIFEAGPSKIVTALGAQATNAFVLDTSTPSYDTTSTNLWRAAAQAEKLSGRLHNVSVSIHSEEVRKRGRPPKNAPAPTTTRYRLEWSINENVAEVARLREMAGCFVLLSNVPTTGVGALDEAGILRTYKGQYGVESDFAFLKDPLVVNDIFLKKPSRIDALGMVLIIALMVWRLMERNMRKYIETTGKTLPGWAGRITEKPTSFMMTTIVRGIRVARIGTHRHLLCPPKDAPAAFIAAMGLDSNVFTDPHFKCTPIIPGKLS